MLICMRTTLNLDDRLARRAKQEAAQRGTTLTALVEAGLRRELEGPRRQAAREPFRMPVSSARAGLAPGVTPEDLLSNARIRELLGDDDAVL
jgi:hypothetical protein